MLGATGAAQAGPHDWLNCVGVPYVPAKPVLVSGPRDAREMVVQDGQRSAVTEAAKMRRVRADFNGFDLSGFTVGWTGSMVAADKVPWNGLNCLLTKS